MRISHEALPAHTGPAAANNRRMWGGMLYLAPVAVNPPKSATKRDEAERAALAAVGTRGVDQTALRRFRDWVLSTRGPHQRCRRRGGAAPEVAWGRAVAIPRPCDGARNQSRPC